jgi:hypothetical protein
MEQSEVRGQKSGVNGNTVRNAYFESRENTVLEREQPVRCCLVSKNGVLEWTGGQ